jgi:Ca-activated chloride channel family protein
MTRISDKGRLYEAIDRLNAGGSTNLGEGLITGYQLARQSFRERVTNRVIILSDGLANTGTTDSATLVSRIQEEAAKEISLLGVGVGSDYGDKLMEELADKGDGFVVYVSEQKQARELFVRRLPATLTVRAYDAKAQVVFDRSTVDTYQLVGYENRALEDNEFRDDTVDGGEIGPGHSVTALYVVKVRNEAKGRVAQIKVRWLDPKTRDASESYETVNVADIDGTFARSDADLKLCYTAAFFAEALRERPSPGLEQLARIAEDANADLDDPQVAELAGLIRKAISNR